jgi:hypothetical protein
MATFLLASLVTMLPLLEEQAAHAAPSQAKVFLAKAPDAHVQKDCLAQVASALTARLAETKGVVPARSAADADVVVQVTECRTARAPKLGGEIGVTAWTGGQGRGVQARTALAGELITVARVVLVVDDQGKPREFASGPDDLPLHDAARSATGPLLSWVKARYTR